MTNYSEARQIEQREVDAAVLTLIKAAKTGLRPNPEAVTELIMALSSKPVAPERISDDDKGNGIEARGTKDERQEIVKLLKLKSKVEAVITECLKDPNVIAGNRYHHIIFENSHQLPCCSFYNHQDVTPLATEISRIIQQSLEDSLDKNDSLEIIAKKLTLLHSFPFEMGGGGYSGGLQGTPKIRKKLLKRLLEELKQSDKILNSDNFKYVQNRLNATPDDKAAVFKQKHNFDALTPTEKVKKLLEIALEE